MFIIYFVAFEKISFTFVLTRIAYPYKEFQALYHFSPVSTKTFTEQTNRLRETQLGSTKENQLILYNLKNKKNLFKKLPKCKKVCDKHFKEFFEELLIFYNKRYCLCEQ